MNRLRSIMAPLAAVLLVLVSMQIFDLPGCADEMRDAAAQATSATHTDRQDSGAADRTNHHDPGGSAMPDCLCHVVFVPGVSLPSLNVPTSAYVLLPEPVARLTTVVVAPPEHIPIA